MQEIAAAVRGSPKPVVRGRSTPPSAVLPSPPLTQARRPPASTRGAPGAQCHVSGVMDFFFFFFFFLTNHGLQEETAAALHFSYDQWDPCGEGEQLQVPRCKHLRGPDLDYTHSNTGQESQTKTVPSATAEKIQGLTSYPENFQFRGHRKCINSVHLSVVW